jgi:hypothetical protein
LFFAHADHLIFGVRGNFGALKATGADERCGQKKYLIPADPDEHSGAVRLHSIFS